MKINIISSFFILITLLSVIIACTKTADKETAPLTSTPDLTKHPIYSNYKFNNTEDVINIGIQPLYFPTGLISEAMKRDLILKKTLLKHGKEIRFYQFLKGDDVNFFLKSGDLDAGVGGDMPAINAASELNVIIPILVQQGFVSIMAKRHMMIKELRGKRVGYAFGSNAHYALLNALASAGLDESQVIFVPLETTEMPEALHEGKIDAFSAWEPVPFLTNKKYPGTANIHKSMSSGYTYFRKSFYDENPDIVRQFLAAEIRSIRWMQKERKNLHQAAKWVISESINLADKKIDLSEEEIASLALDDILGVESIPIIPENYLLENGHLFNEFEFLKFIKKIPSTYKWEQVQKSFNDDALKYVAVNAPEYRLNEFMYNLEGEGNE